MEAALRRGLPIEGLPLNPSVRHKLQCAGFRTTAELEAVAGPVDLAAGGPVQPPPPPPPACLPARRCLQQARSLCHPCPPPLRASEAQLTHEEALLALKLVAPTAGTAAAAATAASVPLSARQIFEREAAAKRIITFAAELDGILGGGVETGAITEFWWVLPKVLLGAACLSWHKARSLQGTAFWPSLQAAVATRCTHAAALLLRCAAVFRVWARRSWACSWR